MFSGTIIVSKQVQNEIPQWLQNMMWYLIETMNDIQKDRVQVFELSNVSDEGVWKQRVIHSQQCPLYLKKYTVSSVNTINAIIFVIDNTTHCVMLMN